MRTMRHGSHPPGKCAAQGCESVVEELAGKAASAARRLAKNYCAASLSEGDPCLDGQFGRSELTSWRQTVPRVYNLSINFLCASGSVSTYRCVMWTDACPASA